MCRGLRGSTSSPGVSPTKRETQSFPERILRRTYKMGEPSDSTTGNDSTFGAFQDSNNNNSDSNIDFWLDILNFEDTSSNQNDFPFDWGMHWLPSRDDQWGHVFQQQQQQQYPKKKRTKKRKARRDMGSSCSAVNSASDVSEALSGALSAISADLSLSSSSPPSSHTSSRKSDQETALYTRGTCSLPLVWNDSLASDLNRNEMPDNSTSEAKAESSRINLSVPEVGKAFASEEEAYNFYRRYANTIGFKVRKGKVQRSPNGDITKRYFYCSREGFRSQKQSNKEKRYKRKETRTGCIARMECTVKNGEWVISQFFEKHNHDLDRMNVESQTRTSETHPVIHFNTKVVKSCSMHCATNGQEKKERCLQPEDAQNLMDHLRHRQAEDPSFFHAIQLDDNCRLTNIFWSDGMSKIDYDYFGDVLILDTSFKVYKHGHNMICASFLGINHHRQFVLFGCALLFDNSTDSFIWLFETFMEAMGRHQPKSIFTDEGEAIGDAVKLVMPEAQHQIGMWYIHQNASKHLSAYFELPGFKKLLNECISDCETEEEFESRWSALLALFNLHGNEWLRNLHASRDRWSHIFSKKTFSAGIQCHASIESIFQNLAGNSSTVSLSTVVEQYLRVAKRQRREELHEDFRCNETELNMILASCPAGLAEKQAASVYTYVMFKAFQKQLPMLLLVTMDDVANDGTIATFKLSEVGRKKEFFVEFNCLDSSISCSCKKYECEGILCIHALKVLNSRDIYEIPAQYILKRWTKSAKDGVVADDHGNNKLFYKALNVIAKSAAVEENEKIAEHYLDRAREKIEKVLETKRSKEHTAQAPDIIWSPLTDEEERVVCGLYAIIGSRWAIIADQLPGRTATEIKNLWNTHLKKRLLMGIDLQTRKPLVSSEAVTKLSSKRRCL